MAGVVEGIKTSRRQQEYLEDSSMKGFICIFEKNNNSKMSLDIWLELRTLLVSPKFLHGNATSHTWLFSAFAELIDNAYDPDVNASEIWIDVRTINNHHCLSFVDNGNGMTPDKLYKMLSFGYCEKIAVGNVKPIGFYGNGFKSGSMRIGKDALVFTRCNTSMSVGMLSQTYLSAINAEAVVVPIVTFDLPSKLRQNTPESLANMKAIMRHSIFNSEHQLISELKALEKMQTGTNIIIYNLKKDKSGNFEIDFESDQADIRNPETQMNDLTSINRPIFQQSPEYKRSLREYCSILYLKPRMKIVIRGQKVATKLISKSLSKTETDVYKPSWLPRPVRLTFGFTNNEESENYGLMMYHKNRLIKAYEKIGCQKQANAHGIGVVGVVEANFLEPIHNKQDFNRTDKYSAFMQNVSMKLNDYFFEKTQNENPDKVVSSSQLPDWTWVQCDNCLSWRRLPTGYNVDLPDKWYCRMNPDAAFNRCDIPEEPEDDDEALQPTYRKTYKKTVEEKRRQAKLEEERRIREKEEQLKKRERLLQHKMQEMTKQHQEKEKQIQKKMKEIEKNKELAEVSSSQDRVDRKPTLRDLEKAKQSISAYQEEVKQKEKTIQQLELQKKKVEEKSQAMLRMAESLKLSTDEGTNLYEKIQEMNGADSSTVTSSSGSTSGLRAPKRKHDMVNDSTKEEEPGVKVVKIKTEDGGTMPVKIVQNQDDSLIDLTLEEDNLNESNLAPDPNEGEKGEETDKSCDKTGSETKTASDELTEMDDVKPDKEELDKKLTEIDKDKEEMNKDEVKKEFVCKYSQTVPTIVKFASPEEVDLLKLTPVEQKETLLLKARELEETKKSLTSLQENMSSLQENILKLLKIIVPDFDYGEPGNIEKIILDFIRVNEEQENSEAQSTASQGE